ncbi:MAG: hypothetical protein AAGD06_10360 [Acidobacteriota bacterium]
MSRSLAASTPPTWTIYRAVSMPLASKTHRAGAVHHALAFDDGSTWLRRLAPFSALIALFVLALLLAPGVSSAQEVCRWDGTAPWCAGSCNPGETEKLQASSADQVQHLPSINPFGNGCVFGTKSYCCSSPGVTCRWDGTAPFCGGECEDDEFEVKRCGSCMGKTCWTGSKVLCCKPNTGSTGQPLVAGPDDARYAAVWDQSTVSSWVARHGMTSSQYQAAFDEYGRKGYRPVHIAGYGVGEVAYFAAIWEPIGGPGWPPPGFFTRHDMTPAEYQAEFTARSAAGYRLTQISGYAVAGEPYYAAIWEQTSGPAWVARHGMTSEEYQQQYDQWTGRGYRLVKVSGFGLDGEAIYAAIWEQDTSGTPWAARHGMTSEGYQDEFNRLGEAGYRVVHLSAFAVDGESRFAAIWEKVSGPAWSARHGMTSDGYQEEFNYKAKDGFRPRVVSGYHPY